MTTPMPGQTIVLTDGSRGTISRAGGGGDFIVTMRDGSRRVLNRHEFEIVETTGAASAVAGAAPDATLKAATLGDATVRPDHVTEAGADFVVPDSEHP